MRAVTPKSSVSSTWSTVADPESLSGAENVPPPGFDICTPWSNKRLSGGVLQDIGHGSITQPKQRRRRQSSGRVSDSDGSLDGTAYGKRVASKTSQNLTIRQRSAKTKTKVSHRRRTVSAETSKYIEHLEAELATTQTQLSRINSPTVTRQQSTRIRTVDAERESLQKEVNDWETQYENRIQEVVDQHYEIELGLRNQIRTLEQDFEESRFRMAELQAQLDTNLCNMEAAEAANVNLERRIEIMSDLLAASPSRIDFHAETPGRARRHVRPKSMLPRFPTASSLLGSPERGPQTQPPSPLLSFANYSPHIPSSPAHSVCRYDSAVQQSDYMSEVESVFSDVSATGDSVTSAGTFDHQSAFNPWTLPPPPPPRSKPARRMRRFGAGSIGPKPLILPSTAHCDGLQPACALPLGRSETAPTFFPEMTASSQDSRAPLLGRKRASTMADRQDLLQLAASPFPRDDWRSYEDEASLDSHIPSTCSSRPPTRGLSSLGSASGRNLMEELTAASSALESCPSSDVSAEQQGDDETSATTDNTPRDLSTLEGTTLVVDLPIRPPTSHVIDIDTGNSLTAASIRRNSDSHPRSISPIGTHSASIFERLRFLFGDIWRSPIDLARHLIRTSQARMRIPRPLLDIHWWVVGVLIGPVARRRVLLGIQSDVPGEESPLMLHTTPTRTAQADRMAYGTLYENPPSPKRSPRGTHTSRTKRPLHRLGCPHRRAKHSPLVWLKFSLTLAFAIGAALKDGPVSLLKATICTCQQSGFIAQSRAGAEAESLI